jgi:hypothetical protein
MTPLNDKGYYAVPVPGDADPNEWILVDVDGRTYLNGMTKDGEMYAGTQPLPPGSWSFICTSDEISEEQAKEIVGVIKAPLCVLYKNYDKETGGDFCRTPKSSFASLLRSLHLIRVAIIKKQE